MSFYVEPLGEEQARFRSSVSETVTARTPIEETSAGLSWAGWQLTMPAFELSITSTLDVGGVSQAALREVVYIMMPVTTAFTSAFPSFDTDVHSVVLIFRNAAPGPSFAVRVLKDTFIAKFKQAIATIATIATVVFATIPDNQMVDSLAPATATAAELTRDFPNIAVTFGAVVFGARANTAIHPLVHHIARTTATDTGTMYFGMVGYPPTTPNHTRLKYGNKHLWPATPPESAFASATLKLVVGPTLASDGFVDHETMQPGQEVELTRVSASTLTTMPAQPCFVSTTPPIKFCPYTGALTHGASEYTLAEVIYVPDVIGGRPASGSVAKWAYVLHFRSTNTTNTNNVRRPFALRLGPENADMLIKVVEMHGMPAAKTVPTSTAIHANSKVALLPPWPNAHSQGTSAAAPVTAAAALPVRPATAPPVFPSLMPLNRARMIHYPAFGYTPAAATGAVGQVQVAAPSVVVRYEPIPTCDQHKTRDAASTSTNWDMWPLCAADASARSVSAACGVFKSCAATTPGASTASLVDARGTSPVNVPLYASNETGVLYGLTTSAVYVVRPEGTFGASDAWSGPSDVTHVVIVTNTSTERLIAKKEAAAAGATAALPVYKIVAAGQPGQLALPCASLVTCMKGTDLALCSSGLFVDCAEAEDRSPVVATLEYDSLQVSLRQLDESMLFGVDSRGAFALHKTTGSVLHTPGVKWPAWPTVNPQASAPIVLKATLDSTGIWRVDATASSKTGLLPLWITLGALGGLLLIVAMIVVLKRR